MMDEIFVSLEKIQEKIRKRPNEFEETDFNVIFELLERNDYETVINRISKNIVPSTEESESIQVPDSPNIGIYSSLLNDNDRSNIDNPPLSISTDMFNISNSSDEHTTYRGKGKGKGKNSQPQNSRKRKRSESDIVLSPIRPPNPAEAAAATLGNTMDTSALELSSVDGMDRSETEIDAILSRLIDIFPHQTPEYLKTIINLNMSLTVDQLVTRILDDDQQDLDGHQNGLENNLVENGVNGLGHNQQTVITQEVVIVSDDEEFKAHTDINTSTPVVQRHKMSMFRNSTMNEPTMSSNKNTSASVNIEAVNGSHNIIVANGDVVPATSKSQVILNGTGPITTNGIHNRTNGHTVDQQSLENGHLVPEHNDVANVTIDLEGVAGEIDDVDRQTNGDNHQQNGPEEPIAGPSQKKAKDDILTTLVSLFPHVDPSYLEKRAEEMNGCQIKLQQFIDQNVGSNDLPNRKNYDAKMAKKSAIDKVKNMKVSDFLREFDNPEETFYENTSAVSDSYKTACIAYVNAKFSYLAPRTITKAMVENKHHLLPTVKRLKSVKSSKRKNAVPKDTHFSMDTLDLGFFKDYIYMKLEPRIREAVRENEEIRKRQIEVARKNGALFECQCCFDDECLLEEVCMCAADHMFCPDCVRRGAETQIGENATRIKCFQECDAEIESQVLERVLKPKIYSRLAERQANEELMNANVENLVQCPACNFAVIIPESEKLIRCENPECGKVSCKECKEENHLPLRCDEVEKDDEVKARTKLENAMAEAMIRECNKCKNRFVKLDGCNKMTCNKCHTKMCYLCKKTITNDYSHFYGHGASPNKNKCPLWSDNDKLHKAEVAKAADETKKELGEKSLKHDPTKDIERPPEGYDPRRQLIPGQPVIPGGQHIHRIRNHIPAYAAMAPYVHLLPHQQRAFNQQLFNQQIQRAYHAAHARHRQPVMQIVPGVPGPPMQNHPAVPMQPGFPPHHPGQFFVANGGPPQPPPPQPQNPRVRGPEPRAGPALQRMLDQQMGNHRIMDYIRQDIEALMQINPAGPRQPLGGHAPHLGGHRRARHR